MLDFDGSIWLVGLMLLTVFLIIFRRRQRSLSYLLCFSVFWIYLLLVIKVTLFPIPLFSEMADIMRQTPFMTGVNLMPGYFGPYAQPESIGRSVILNIILTVPFGFGISFIARCKAKDFRWLSFAVGFAIEGMQLVISLAIGFPYRTIDVNDLLCNTVGVFIGYGFFRAFAWLFDNTTAA